MRADTRKNGVLKFQKHKPLSSRNTEFSANMMLVDSHLSARNHFQLLSKNVCIFNFERNSLNVKHAKKPYSHSSVRRSYVVVDVSATGLTCEDHNNRPRFKRTKKVCFLQPHPKTSDWKQVLKGAESLELKNFLPCMRWSKQNDRDVVPQPYVRGLQICGQAGALDHPDHNYTLLVPSWRVAIEQPTLCKWSYCRRRRRRCHLNKCFGDMQILCKQSKRNWIWARRAHSTDWCFAHFVCFVYAICV